MITRTRTILLEGLKDLSNATAWQQFDARYRPLLLAAARRLGLNSADGEDAAQETLTAFIVEYREGRYRRETGRLRDWLGGIMAHKVRDVQRRRYRLKMAGGSADANALEQIEDSRIQAAVEEEAGQAALRECLEAVRREVSPQMFESFELSALQRWPAKQVAEKLGISAEVVYQNKRRVLQRIRDLLPEIESTW